MKKTLSKIGFGLSLIILAACGSSPTNNQGVSFTLLGFFQDTASSGDTSNGELGQSVPLSDENPETSSDNLAGAVTTVVGLQNNITTQFLRVDRLDMDYYIEGSNIQPPSTMVPLTMLLGKASSSTGTGSSSGSSSGSTTSSSTNLQYGKFPIVTTEVMTWLNFNRNSLPELPFTMIASVKASAVSSAGDRYDSNEGSYFIIFTPDNVIAPTEGQ